MAAATELRAGPHYHPRYNNPLTTFDCLGENFRSCQGLPPRR